MTNLHILFVPNSVSIAASQATKLPTAWIQVPMLSTTESLLTGKETTSSQKLESKYALCSMSQATAIPQALHSMDLTPAPSVVTHGMLPLHSPRIDLTKILYMHTTPYIASNWEAALDLCNISHLFPNLINNIIFRSPIGYPPPLTTTFLL